MSRAPKPPGRRARGFSVVEVMMALAVLTLGAGGVITMQKATLFSNTRARDLVTANGIAQTWMERMRTDALAWTNPSGVPNLTSATLWLRNAAGAQPIGSGWVTPATSVTTGYPSGVPVADVMGADIFSGDPSAPGFCTQVRLTQFSTNPNLWALSRMIRIEVRVYWDQTGRTINCAAALPTDYQLSRYGFVYLVSSVLENNSPI
jgi:prepilin-type N-terminal cleavage/methylation domain-containing protein